MALSIDSADVNCIASLKSVDQQCLSCKFNTDFQRYPTPEPQLASENSRCCNEEPDLLMMWPSYFVQQLILEKSVTWNFSKRIFSSFMIFLFLLPQAGRTILPRMSLLLRRPFLYVKGLITLQHRNGAHLSHYFRKSSSLPINGFWDNMSYFGSQIPK